MTHTNSGKNTENMSEYNDKSVKESVENLDWIIIFYVYRQSQSSEF